MEGILNNIYQIRTKLGYSQEYMANRLNIKQSGYNMIEKGERELKYSTLSQIAIIFEMDVINVIKYPDKYVNADSKKSDDEIKAVLQLELTKDKKEKVLKIVFGEHNFEILSK